MEDNKTQKPSVDYPTSNVAPPNISLRRGSKPQGQHLLSSQLLNKVRGKNGVNKSHGAEKASNINRLFAAFGKGLIWNLLLVLGLSVLLMLSFSGGNQTIARNLQDDIKRGELTQDYWQEATGSTVDGFTECIGSTIGLIPAKSELSLPQRLFMVPRGTSCVELPQFINQLDTDPQSQVGPSTPYIRYWSGFAVISRPAIFIGGITLARTISLVFLFSGIFAWSIEVVRRVGILPVLGLLAVITVSSNILQSYVMFTHAISLGAVFWGGILVIKISKNPLRAYLSAILSAGIFVFVDLITSPPLSAMITVFSAGIACLYVARQTEPNPTDLNKSDLKQSSFSPVHQANQVDHTSQVTQFNREKYFIRNSNASLPTLLKYIVASGIGWCFGYAFTWFMRWVEASFYLGIKPVLENVVETAKFRLDGTVTRGGIKTGVSNTWGTSTVTNFDAWQKIAGTNLALSAFVFLTLGVLLGIIFYICSIGWFKKIRISSRKIGRAAIVGTEQQNKNLWHEFSFWVTLSLTAIIAPLWYETFKNHSQIHSFFMYRALPFALGLITLIWLVLLKILCVKIRELYMRKQAKIEP